MFNNSTSLDEYIKELIESNPEIKKKLINKISEAVDKVDLTENIQNLIDDCIENADVDITGVLKSIITKKIKIGIQ